LKQEVRWLVLLVLYLSSLLKDKKAVEK